MTLLRSWKISFLISYIGAKKRLAGELKSILTTIPKAGTALDVFAGTGTVSRLFHGLGYQVITNDWQTYAQTLLHATFRGRPDTARLSELNHLTGTRGAFYEAYCEGGTEGRLYFSQKNGLRIQAIRDRIHYWRERHTLDEDTLAWLLASLISAADKVANTASVYGAYLKTLKPTSQKTLHLSPPAILQPSKRHPIMPKIYGLDAGEFLDQMDTTPATLTYLDPPYNHRQYSNNYHLLETLTCWDLDRFTPHGKTGQRPVRELKSVFCKKRLAYPAFEKLFSKIRSRYVLFSYNNDGILSEEELTLLFSRFCKDFLFKKIRYKRFQADLPSRRRVNAVGTEEWLVLGELDFKYR